MIKGLLIMGIILLIIDEHTSLSTHVSGFNREI